MELMDWRPIHRLNRAYGDCDLEEVTVAMQIRPPFGKGGPIRVTNIGHHKRTRCWQPVRHTPGDIDSAGGQL